MFDILFGLFESETGLTVKILESEQKTQSWLLQEFQSQFDFFVSSIKEEKSFDAHAITHDDELYTIDYFPDKDILENLLSSNRDSYGSFTNTDFKEQKPKALGVIIVAKNKTHICLQLFSQRNILAGRNVLGFNGNALKQNQDYLICLDNKLSAIYVDGVLKFKSFHIVKQIFNLKDFYKELSNEQIEKLIASLDNFSFQDREATLQNLNQKTRKLFSALEADDYIRKTSAKKLQEKIHKDTEIEVTVEKGLLHLPKDPKTLFNVLNSILGNVFEDERTSQSLIATSKEKLITK